MYDFYANPPRTRADIRNYLTTWLKPVENAATVTYSGESFVQELGFSESSIMHCVFRSLSTNEYIWSVNGDTGPQSIAPMKRYPTFNALIDGVVEDYYGAWKSKD